MDASPTPRITTIAADNLLQFLLAEFADLFELP
jgi:hypothetical protein